MNRVFSPPVCSLSVSVPASCEEVFNFLADVENLPRWAGRFCERLQLSRGSWLALTTLGELFVELEADAHTGVIDLRLDDEHALAMLLSLRVVALPAGGTLVSGLLLAQSGQREPVLAGLCEVFARALAQLASQLPASTPWAGSTAAQIACLA